MKKSSRTIDYSHLPNFVAFDISRSTQQWWHFIDFLFAMVFFRLIIWKVWNKVKTHTQRQQQTNLFWYLYIPFIYCVCVRVFVCLFGGLFVWTHTHFRFINHWFVLPIWYFAQTQTHFTEKRPTTATALVVSPSSNHRRHCHPNEGRRRSRGKKSK